MSARASRVLLARGGGTPSPRYGARAPCALPSRPRRPRAPAPRASQAAALDARIGSEQFRGLSAEQMRAYGAVEALQRELDDIDATRSAAKENSMADELRCMKRVLRRLGHTNGDNVIELKGRWGRRPLARARALAPARRSALRLRCALAGSVTDCPTAHVIAALVRSFARALSDSLAHSRSLSPSLPRSLALALARSLSRSVARSHSVALARWPVGSGLPSVRIACEVSTADELLITELIFTGSLVRAGQPRMPPDEAWLLRQPIVRRRLARVTPGRCCRLRPSAAAVWPRGDYAASVRPRAWAHSRPSLPPPPARADASPNPEAPFPPPPGPPPALRRPRAGRPERGANRLADELPRRLGAQRGHGRRQGHDRRDGRARRAAAGACSRELGGMDWRGPRRACCARARARAAAASRLGARVGSHR